MESSDRKSVSRGRKFWRHPSYWAFLAVHYGKKCCKVWTWAITRSFREGGHPQSPYPPATWLQGHWGKVVTHSRPTLLPLYYKVTEGRWSPTVPLPSCNLSGVFYIVGLLPPLLSAFAIVLGGWITSKYKLTVQQDAKFIFVCSLAATVVLVPTIFLTCPQSSVQTAPAEYTWVAKNTL